MQYATNNEWNVSSLINAFNMNSFYCKLGHLTLVTYVSDGVNSLLSFTHECGWNSFECIFLSHSFFVPARGTWHFPG